MHAATAEVPVVPESELDFIKLAALFLEVEIGCCDFVVPFPKAKLVSVGAGTSFEFIFLADVELAKPVTTVAASNRAVAAENPSDFVFVCLETPKINRDPLVLVGAGASARSLFFVAVPNEKFGLLLVAFCVVFISLLLLVDFPPNVDCLNNL